jgi:hypothetical protein
MLLAHFFTLQSDLIIKISDGKVSNSRRECPKLSRANLLSVRAGACQPQGGVPRYRAVDLDLTFLQSTQKTVAKLSWTACKHPAKMLGKDNYKVAWRYHAGLVMQTPEPSGRGPRRIFLNLPLSLIDSLIFPRGISHTLTVYPQVLMN